jgi:peptide/nickel transport system ATP-binding protein
VREAHKKIDPALEATGGADPAHKVACLLPAETRRALWAALRAGETPDEVLQEVELPDTLSASAQNAPEAPATSGEEVSGQ